MRQELQMNEVTVRRQEVLSGGKSYYQKAGDTEDRSYYQKAGGTIRSQEL